MHPTKLRMNSTMTDACLSGKSDVIKIVVTDGTTDLALTFLYRILYDNVFGENQLIFVSVFEFEEKALFLQSVAIELTSFSPSLLQGISHGHDPSVQFKDADVVICIGVAREYEFCEEEYSDPFFRDYTLTSKYYVSINISLVKIITYEINTSYLGYRVMCRDLTILGTSSLDFIPPIVRLKYSWPCRHPVLLGQVIEQYAKRDARIIVIGSTAATVISKYVKSIPLSNITALSMFNLNITTAYIAARARCLPTDVKNVIIWGTNNKHNFPDCRYMFFKDGRNLSNSFKVWLRNNLQKYIENISSRPYRIRSMAYGLAEHCRILWHGTPTNEWTCMSVLSNHSYGIRSDIFYSFPVICRDRQYEIVQGLINDEYIKRYTTNISKIIDKEVHVALGICGLTKQSGA